MSRRKTAGMPLALQGLSTQTGGKRYRKDCRFSGVKEYIFEVIDLATAEGVREVTCNDVDASTTSPLDGSEVRILNTSDDNDGSDIVLITDSNGQASVVLSDGDYTVQTASNSYIIRTNSITVSENAGKNVTVGMSRANMLVGSLTATEMTYQEIIEAGIDVKNPDNQHVFNFTLILEFSPEVGKPSYSIPVNYYGTNSGRILWSSSSGGGGGSGSGGSGGATYIPFCEGGVKGYVYPVARDVYLIIYGKVGWLKEMFHVQLLLTNTSAVDYIENCVAELLLPEGLSLAAMLSDANNQNTCVQTVNGDGKIGELESACVDWYVRCDMEGEYIVSAKVTEEYLPNPEPFERIFTTETPITVWAGSAMHLYIEADNCALKGQEYNLIFRLENVSSKILYKVSLDVFGGQFLSDFGIEDLEYSGDFGLFSGLGYTDNKLLGA